MRPLPLVVLPTLLLLGCPAAKPDAGAAKRPAAAASAAAASQPSDTPASRPAGAASRPGAASQPSRPSEAAIQARVTAATARLRASPAGRRVLDAAEAHGGLGAWFEGRALRFRYDYKPVEGTRRNSLQTVDLLSSRAYHRLDHPAQGRLAFDGAQAWSALEGDAKFAARFWALTPYYFVGMPFVLSDPGVTLSLTEDDPAAAGLSEADVVRATFTPGTGDAPDDYYVLYISKKDDRLLALRYVVTYSPFFEGKATKSTPEKLLVFEAPAPAGRLTALSRRHVFYAFGDGKRGPKLTVADVSEVEYGAEFDEAALSAPDGAVVDRSL